MGVARYCSIKLWPSIDHAKYEPGPSSGLAIIALYNFDVKFQNSGAWPRSAVCRASDSRARDPGFDTRSGHILSFLLPLTQEGQLSVTGESMCTKYWLTA